LLGGSGVVSIVLLIGLVGSGQATFPGGDGKIVFENPRSGGFYTVNPNGSDERRIPRTGPLNGINSDPSFSNSGRRIVFSHTNNDSDVSSIVTINADGSNRQTVIRRRGLHFFDPSFYPSGKRIVFVFRDSIFAVRTSGSHLHELGGNPGHDIDPSYSPGGRLIVWSSGWRINLMHSDGTHEHVVAQGPHYGEPSFSPDGERILFTGGPRVNDTVFANILEMNLDGTDRHHVTTDAGVSAVYHSPHFSPQGTRIVFVRQNPSPECTDCESVQVMRADGANRHRVTQQASFQPDWGPAVTSPYR
jgi:Tol biopolymer transport system component